MKAKVVLIGGAPGAEKTSLGRALASRIGAVSLSADDLFTAARAVTTPQSHPGFHVMNRPNFVDYFTASSVEQLITDARAQHEAVWPAIRSVVRLRAASGREPAVVIDGWFFRPTMVSKLDLENVTSFWLVADHGVLEERERNDEVFDGSSDPERMLQNFLGRSYWYNDLIRQEVERLRLPILHQDGNASVEDLCNTAVSLLESDA